LNQFQHFLAAQTGKCQFWSNLARQHKPGAGT